MLHTNMDTIFKTCVCVCVCVCLSINERRGDSTNKESLRLLTMFLSEGDPEPLAVGGGRRLRMRAHPFPLLHLLDQASLHQVPEHDGHGHHVLLLEAGVPVRYQGRTGVV